MKKQNVHVGGLLIFLPILSDSINDMRVLLVRKIEEENATEIPGYYKSIGISTIKCVDANEESYIHDKEKFLDFLRDNLESSYGFNSEATHVILQKEEVSERNYKDRALIIAFLVKSRTYPLSFEKITSKKEYGIKRKVYFVHQVLTQENQTISDPQSLHRDVPADDCVRRELVSFPVKEAYEVLFQKFDRYAVSFISLGWIVKFIIERRYKTSTSSRDDRVRAAKMIKEYESYSTSLIGS